MPPLLLSATTAFARGSTNHPDIAPFEARVTTMRHDVLRAMHVPSLPVVVDVSIVTVRVPANLGQTL